MAIMAMSNRVILVQDLETHNAIPDYAQADCEISRFLHSTTVVANRHGDLPHLPLWEGCSLWRTWCIRLTSGFNS